MDRIHESPAEMEGNPCNWTTTLDHPSLAGRICPQASDGEEGWRKGGMFNERRAEECEHDDVWQPSAGVSLSPTKSVVLEQPHAVSPSCLRPGHWTRL